MITIQGPVKSVYHQQVVDLQVIRDPQAPEISVIFVDGDGTAHIYPLNEKGVEALQNGLVAARTGLTLAGQVPKRENGKAA